MYNPFSYGGIVKGKLFCNRREEIKTLKRDILSGQNLLLYAPRRFGKSSLIFETIDKLKKEEPKFRYIFLDLMSIATQEEFVQNYFNAIANTLEEPTDKVVRFFKEIAKIRPNIKVTFSDSGQAKFSLEFFKKDMASILEDILNTPLHFTQKFKIAVIFDEFQEIEALGLENKFRSIIQQHSNKLSYIFLGSKKSIIAKMFQDKQKAFYRSVKHITLKPIPTKEWEEFIIYHFKETGKRIDPVFVQEIVNFTKGFPYYTQQFAYELWNICEKEVDESLIDRTKEIILSHEQEIFVTEWDMLTHNQKKVLKLVAASGGENVYNEELLLRFEIKSASLQAALKSLIAKDILDKKDVYYFQDPLFEYWIRRSLC
jgi:hypothetical protein